MVAAIRYRKKSGFRVGAAGVFTGIKKFARSSIGKAVVKRTAQKLFQKKKSSGAPVFKNVKIEGTGGQISRFIASYPAKGAVKMMKKINSSNYLYGNSGYRVVAGVGSMGALSVSHWGSGSYATVATVDNDLAYIANKISGGTTTAGNSSRTTRYCAESCVSDFRMTNQDTGNVEVHIYDIVCKRDSTLSPVAAMNAGLYDSTNVNYTVAYPPGWYPQMSQCFNVNYKVKQHTRVILGQGQSHSHSIKLNTNRIFQSEILQDANLAVAGFTCFTMITVQGLPANDSTTVTQVSTGAAALDVVVTKTMKYTWSSDVATQIYQGYVALPTSFTVGESIMDIGSGAKSADLPA